jgi:hypothetical protein
MALYLSVAMISFASGISAGSISSVIWIFIAKCCEGCTNTLTQMQLMHAQDGIRPKEGSRPKTQRFATGSVSRFRFGMRVGFFALG